MNNNKKKNIMKKLLLYFLAIAIILLIHNNFCLAVDTYSNITQSPGVIQNLSYSLKPGVQEINLKQIGVSDYTIAAIKNKEQTRYTISINTALVTNSIYLDKTLNISIKVISIISRYGAYEVTFEIPKLNEVFDNLIIPEQNVGIKVENIIRSSIPENVIYSGKTSEDLNDGDTHLFNFDDYEVPNTDLKINGSVTLTTPKILTELNWNQNFKVQLSTGQKVDINVSGNWNFASDSQKILLSNIEVPSDDGIGNLFAGLYVNVNSTGDMNLSVDIEQDLNYSASIEGDLKYGVDPLNIRTGYDMDKNLAAQVKDGDVTNSYFPIELFAGLDILGQEIKIVCTMGVEVNGSKSNNILYVDIDGRCIGNAYIFGEIINIFDKRWDIYNYEIPLSTIISFTASRTSIVIYQNTILSWSVANATSISITTSTGATIKNLAANGSLMITPNRTTTFTLKVVDEYGNVETRELTITVRG